MQPRYLQPVLVAAFLSLTPLSAAAASYYKVSDERAIAICESVAAKCQRFFDELARFEFAFRRATMTSDSERLKPVAILLIGERDARATALPAEIDRFTRTENLKFSARIFPSPSVNILVAVDIPGLFDSLEPLLPLYALALLQDRRDRPQPTWFEQGISQIFNGFTANSRGSIEFRVDPNIAPPVGSDYGDLRSQLPLKSLLEIDSSKLTSIGDQLKYQFAARNFASFGLLAGEQRARQYHDLAMRCGRGENVETATQAAFGKALIDVETEWRRFYGNKLRKSVRWSTGDKNLQTGRTTQISRADFERYLRIVPRQE